MELISNILSVHSENQKLEEERYILDEQKDELFQSLKNKVIKKNKFKSKIKNLEIPKKDSERIGKLKKDLFEKYSSSLKVSYKVYNDLLNLYEGLCKEKDRIFSPNNRKFSDLWSKNGFEQTHSSRERNIIESSVTSNTLFSVRGANDSFSMKGRKDMKKMGSFPFLEIRRWKKSEYLQWLDEIHLFPHFSALLLKSKQISSFSEFVKISREKLFWSCASEREKRMMRFNLYYLYDQYYGDRVYRREFSLVLYKFSLFPDFLFRDIEKTGILNAIRDLLDPDKISSLLFQQELEESALPIYLVITDSTFPKRSVVDYISSNVDYLRNPHHIVIPKSPGKYYCGLILNNWFLQFPGRKNHQLVLPQRVVVEMNASVIRLSMINLRKLALKIKAVSDVILSYNTQVFDSEILNCMTFVEDVLKALGYENVLETLDHDVVKCLQEMKENGFSLSYPIQFKSIRNWNFSDISMWLKSCRLEKVFGSYFQKKVRKGNDLIILSFPDKSALGEKIRDLIKIAGDDQEAILRLRYCLCNIYKSFRDKRVRKLRYMDGIIQILHKILKEKKKNLENSGYKDWNDQISYKMISKDENFAFCQVHRDVFRRDKLSILSDFVKNTLETSSIKIKLNVTEISQNLQSDFQRKLLSRVLEYGGYFKKHDFGFFHSAIIIGPWYLEWNNSSFVNIRPISKVQSQHTFCVLDLCPIVYSGEQKSESAVIDWLKSIREKIIDVVVYWNTQMEYDRKRVNCQTFVDDILYVLGVSREESIPRGTCLSEYVDEVRRSGIAKMAVKPTKLFFEKFKNILCDPKKFGLEMKKEYIFTTHISLDNFVHTLLKGMNISIKELELLFPQMYRLLKAFDRSFWLKHWNDRLNERFKPRKGVEYGNENPIGCPFNHPTMSGSIYRKKENIL